MSEVRTVERSARRNEIVNRMLSLQKIFIDWDQAGQFSAEEVYVTPAGHTLQPYKEEYDRLVTELVDLAHQEVGSKR